MQENFTFCTPRVKAAPRYDIHSPWMGMDTKENTPFNGFGLTDADRQKTYSRWMDKTGQLPLSPLVLSANKPAAAKHVMDKGAVASADSGSDAGAARFNKWLTATEGLVFTPKKDLLTLNTPVADTSPSMGAWTPGILGLQGHPLSQEHKPAGALGAGWYPRSPVPDALHTNRQPEFLSDDEISENEGEADEEQGAEHEGEASLGYQSMHAQHNADYSDAQSDMAVSQLGVTMSHLKVQGGHAQAMEMSPAPSALFHHNHAHHAAVPATPIDEVIDLMVHNPSAAAAAAAEAVQPQQLDFGMEPGTPAVPLAGIDAVDYDGYDQESSDDEVDVASLNLGFTPMTLSSRGPMSPIQDLLEMMMSPGPVVDPMEPLPDSP